MEYLNLCDALESFSCHSSIAISDPIFEFSLMLTTSVDADILRPYRNLCPLKFACALSAALSVSLHAIVGMDED